MATSLFSDIIYVNIHSSVYVKRKKEEKVVPYVCVINGHNREKGGIEVTG
jgi:hypothetical protein